ncbi:hypothetical protein AX16_001848 [Volvariella volvacea WC 439]|nr:hypothetical protein AX16_001848 [Volvariella volvacea WC 439]
MDQEYEEFAETVKVYPNYAAASVAACAWVNRGPKNVDPGQLHHYIGYVYNPVSVIERTKAKDGLLGGWVTAGAVLLARIGLKTHAGVITPLVRLDIDDVPPKGRHGKGIHFNAVSLTNASDKLAAVLMGTPDMDVPARRNRYFDYLKALEHRSPRFIWEWWSTGRAPALESEPSEEAESSA